MRKIVLLAGPKDGKHPAGTHEYADTVRTIQKALESSNVAGQVKVEIHTNGWPEDPKTLDDADAILLVSAGADHNEADHPFLVGDRMQVLEKQMDRGCGLVLLHWSVFVPVKYEEQFVRWVGGFFDYQRGDDPRGWYSDITFATATIRPNPKHPIAKGVPPFEHKDEYYYNIRFGKDDERVTPVVTVTLPEVEQPQVVAWAVERKDGGRGFAFTGGHFQKSWEEDAYRTLMLNAVCWTAKVPVPAGGVHKTLAFDDLWTPTRHLGKADLPKEKESDWIDPRIRESDVGPFYTTSLVAPDESGKVPEKPRDDRKDETPDPNMVVKALAIKVGGKDGVPPAAVLFDKEKMVLRCGWTGGFLNFSDRRFGLLEKPTIGGEVAWSVPGDARWTKRTSTAAGGESSAPDLDYRGLRLAGDRVILKYAVGGREVEESPSVATFGEYEVTARTIRIEPGAGVLAMPIAGLAGGQAQPIPEDRFSSFRFCHFVKGGQAVAVALVPRTGRPYGRINTAKLEQSERGDWCRLVIKPNSAVQEYVALLWRGPAERVEAFRRHLNDVLFGPAPKEEVVKAGERLAESLLGVPAEAEKVTPERRLLRDLLFLPQNPGRRWGEPLVTKGVIGSPEAGSPFAVDTITIPYENRYKALFFAGGFDFAPDGACYLCTAHGDVWKVTGIDSDLDEIKWQRFATGLYEPLGLKVRNGEVFVLGRDQVTRLHDANGDGEADDYECFNDDLTDQGQAHAYAMCLETDREGNFYFLKSGAPDTPHGGTLLKLSADGKHLEVFATGFRHANGLSVGPDGTVTAADNEGNWVPVTRLDFVEKGEFCGHVPTAHLADEPTDPGLPVCWLPRVVDNSAGGQAWIPPGEWGPLAGQLLHLSFGRCTTNLILKERVDGTWQGGAVRLPTQKFLSGVCRGRFRTEGAGADGHLYVCGLNGWSSEAEADGCFQRVRNVGGPLAIPTELHVRENGIEIGFPEPVDRELASKPARYAVDVWNYRWSKDYGSEDYSAADPTRQGRDTLKVTGATVSDDGRRVFVTVEGLTPVMQVRVQAGLRSADGAELPVDYYGTVHRLGRANSAVIGGAETDK
jgi:type 1 glutamine amidotransferase